MTLDGQRSENFEILRFRYLEGDRSACAARELIQKQFGSKKLAWLLRSHLVEEVSLSEIRKRDAVDDLLAFYSLVEVAIICGYVSSVLPEDFVNEAAYLLAEPSVERFYGRLYPQLLPQLIVTRLRGRFAAPEHEPVLGSRAFIRFLDITELLKGREVETFLWLLDDGIVGGDSFDDLIALIQSPALLAEALTKEPRKRRPRDAAAHGFRVFTAFCRQLDDLLQATAEMPLLQSALWHHHGYWLNLLSGSVLGVMSTVIEQQRQWVTLDPVESSSDPKNDRVDRTHRSMDTTELVLQRLTSGVYRAKLEEFFFTNELRPQRSAELLMESAVQEEDEIFADELEDATVEITVAKGQGGPGGGATAPGRTYTVQAGDTLSKISKQFYGSANDYMKIFNANKDKLTDPDKIKPGQQLTVPR